MTLSEGYRYGRKGKTPVGPLLGPNCMWVKRGIKLQANFLLHSNYCCKDGLASSSSFWVKVKTIWNILEAMYQCEVTYPFFTSQLFGAEILKPRCAN